MTSIWKKTTNIAHRDPLSGSCGTQVAVIGGGLAGILTAYFLQRQGISVIVLEAKQIGSGQTQNTTAKITSQHNLIYHKIIQNYGHSKAKQYADANQWAIEEYRRIINEKNISCCLEEVPSYLYSTQHSRPLMREAEAARSLGIDAFFTTQTALPFPIKGAVKFSGQAHFHPLKFLEAIAEELTIYENTRVEQVNGNQIRTNHGIVTAEQIVFTTHFPFVNFPGYYFMRMHQERSYALALKQAIPLDGMYLGVDDSGLSFRNCGDLLLLGGGSHRTGKNHGGGKYHMLQRNALKLFPSCKVAAYWSAQDCMTLDGIPYIGQFSGATPNWYVATGFGKWGMTSSMAAARILSDQISGKENPWASVFSPKRFSLAACGKQLIVNIAASVAGLTKGLFSIPRCPHLGCRLQWNPDERSWDCPCHGSRFDKKGNLLDNPAQKNLPHS